MYHMASNFTFRFIFHRIVYNCAPKDRHFFNCLKLETTVMFFNGRMNKWWYIDTRKYYTTMKINKINSISESCKHNIDWKIQIYKTVYALWFHFYKSQKWAELTCDVRSLDSSYLWEGFKKWHKGDFWSS